MGILRENFQLDPEILFFQRLNKLNVMFPDLEKNFRIPILIN